MAILTLLGNEYDVRIKRHPNAYFDEYVKTGNRDKNNATQCDRYIVGEEGVTYKIEATLKKGFTFSICTGFRVKLMFPGQQEAVSYICIHTGICGLQLGRQKILGTRFAIRSLVMGSSRECYCLKVDS